MRKLLDYIRMPGTENVYCIAMAREYYFRNSLPMTSAVDKAMQRSKAPSKINSSGQKVKHGLGR